MIEITLNKNEIYIASVIGARRNIESAGSREFNKVKNKDFGWHIDIEAAAAELALAKALGVYWDFSVNTYKRPDVGGYQVRHTQVPGGKLILRPGDAPNEKYILVIGSTPLFVVAGWVWGHDAMVDEYIFRGFNGMPDCWMVPQAALMPADRIASEKDGNLRPVLPPFNQPDGKGRSRNEMV